MLGTFVEEEQTKWRRETRNRVLGDNELPGL